MFIDGLVIYLANFLFLNNMNNKFTYMTQWKVSHIHPSQICFLYIYNAPCQKTYEDLIHMC